MRAFFSLFNVMTKPKKGTKKDGEARQGWVSFRQPMKHFELYTQSLKGFKGRYFYVVTKNRAARKTFFHYMGDELGSAKSHFYLNRSHLDSPTL